MSLTEEDEKRRIAQERSYPFPEEWKDKRRLVDEIERGFESELAQTTSLLYAARSLESLERTSENKNLEWTSSFQRPGFSILSLRGVEGAGYFIYMTHALRYDIGHFKEAMNAKFGWEELAVVLKWQLFCRAYLIGHLASGEGL